MDNRVEDFDKIVNRLSAEIQSNGGTVQYTVTVEKKEKFIEEVSGDWYRHSSESGVESFAYAPSYPKITEKKAVIFTQVVSDLEIAELVRAVNGIPLSDPQASDNKPRCIDS
jgi:hypothetical protein